MCLRCGRYSGRTSDVDKCRKCINEEFDFIFDWPKACRELFKIEHRDQVGHLVPFIFNSAQEELVRVLYRIMFLEIVMQHDAASRGEPTYIRDILGRVERGEPIYPYEVGVSVLIGKSRRRGMSAVIQAVQQLFMVFAGNYPCMLMAHNGRSAEEIGRMSSRYYDHWNPEYLHHRPGTKHDSVSRLEFDNESRRQVFTAGGRGEKEQSRGWAFLFDHFSEYGFYESYSEVLATSAVAPPHAWKVKESTGNGPTGPFYNEWQMAMSIDEAEDAWFHRDVERLSSWGIPKHQYKIFFSYLDDEGMTAAVSPWEHEELDKLDDYERGVKERHPLKFTRNKIKWRRATIQRECQGHSLPAEAFHAQEWPCEEKEMFQATGSKVYARYVALLGTFEAESKKPPLVRAHFDGYSEPMPALFGRANLLIYAPPKRTHKYIIGADAAHGTDNDFHYAVIFDRHDGTYFEEVCSFYDRQMDAKAFGHVVTALAELFNDAFIVPEIQGGGLTAASTIIEDNRYTRVYQKRTYGQLGHQDSNVFRYGIFTSPQVKDAEVNTARALFDAKQCLIRTPFLLEQIRAYEFDPDTQKYTKPSGGEDDGVDAMHLAFFGARYAPPIRGYIEDIVDRVVEAIDGQLPEHHRALFAAVAKKIERGITAAKRAGKHIRQEPKPPPKRPIV